MSAPPAPLPLGQAVTYRGARWRIVGRSYTGAGDAMRYDLAAVDGVPPGQPRSLAGVARRDLDLPGPSVSQLTAGRSPGLIRGLLPVRLVTAARPLGSECEGRPCDSEEPA